MHRIGGVFILVICMSVALAEAERQDKPATPAEKYQALLKEREDAPEDLSKAKTAEDVAPAWVGSLICLEACQASTTSALQKFSFLSAAWRHRGFFLFQSLRRVIICSVNANAYLNDRIRITNPV